MSHDLSQLGWDESFACAYRPLDRSDSTPGRVLRADRGVCTVLGAAGVIRATLGRRGAARPPPTTPPGCRAPATGSCCGGGRTAGSPSSAVLPRRTALIRRTADKDSSGQVLAANMDTVAVVEPMHPQPDDARIERLLALAWESGAQPVRGADQGATPRADPAGDRPAARRAGAGRAGAAGQRARRRRARRAARARRARAHAGAARPVRRRQVHAGQRAGRDARSCRCSEIRRADGKGRHTTAYRSLVPVPGGGAVLDTPGIRGVGLLDTGAGLDRAFADIAELAAACRFGDCRHDGRAGLRGHRRARRRLAVAAPAGELAQAAPRGRGGERPQAVRLAEAAGRRREAALTARLWQNAPVRAVDEARIEAAPDAAAGRRAASPPVRRRRGGA